MTCKRVSFPGGTTAIVCSSRTRQRCDCGCAATRLCDEEIGSVLDADGMEVFVVDANSDLNDDSATAIAELFADAINARGFI